MSQTAMRTATEAELAHWDEFVAANPDGGHVLQTKTWGEFKARWGWQSHHFMYEMPDGRQVAALWLVRRIPLQGNIWYCPKGPGVTAPADYYEIVKQTRAANLPGVWMRFESEVLDDDIANKSSLSEVGLVRANRDPGSKSTIFIDLAPSEDEILASFNQSARRNIRKATAAGVVAELVEPTASNLIPCLSS